MTKGPKMSVAEKIREYLNAQITSGKLHPGDKLPTYGEIQSAFGISYTSAQRAFKKLEQGGLIKTIQGVGSFLNGGDPLDVDFFLLETTFDFKKLQPILDGISKELDLHLNIHLKNMNRQAVSPDQSSRKVVITEADPWLHNNGTLLDYSIFPDFHNVMDSLFVPLEKIRIPQRIPFFHFTYLMMCNRKLLKKAGIPEDFHKIASPKWWKRFSDACKRNGISPAFRSSHQRKSILWNFSNPFVLFVLMMLHGNGGNPEKLFAEPCMTGETGKKIFDIYDTLDYLEDEQKMYSAALTLNIGSWFTAQYSHVFHFSPEDFSVFAPEYKGRRLLEVETTWLQTFITDSITFNEKERIWKFIKALLSKPVQKKIVSIAGLVSTHRDMMPEDHGWVRNHPDFKEFLPCRNDILFTRKMLSRELITAFSLLLELYDQYKLPQQIIREVIDFKITPENENDLHRNFWE